MKKKKKIRARREKELEVPFWLLDGFVGILGLMIYNFVLYLITALGIRGVILEMQNTMGYFGLLFFTELGFTASQMSIGIVFVFLMAFVLGIGIGGYIRKRKGE